MHQPPPVRLRPTRQAKNELTPIFGRISASRDIPDVIGVRRNGVVDAWEVRSATDPVRDLEIRLENGMKTLPVERRGQIKVIEPEPPNR